MRCAQRESPVAGNLNDPWTPINLANQAAVHPTSRGFGPGLTLRLLLDPQRYRPAPLQSPLAHETTDGPLYVIARTLLANRGWLAYSNRRIALPRPARMVLGQTRAGDDAGEILKHALAEITETARTALAPAVAALPTPLKRDVDVAAVRETPEGARLLECADAAFEAAAEQAALSQLDRLIQEPGGEGPGHSALRRALVKAAFESLDQAAALHCRAGLSGHRTRDLTRLRLNDRLYQIFRRPARTAAGLLEASS
jgi:hypothetical protein